MSNNGPVPNPTVLNGVSLFPPTITGDILSGILVAWSDGSQIFVASDQDSPPYTPRVVNTNWSTQSPPAVALGPDWGRVYLAWTDGEGNILLGSSTDGFNQAIPISRNGSDHDGPALAFGDDLLYIAWRKSGLLCTATVDFEGNINLYDQSDQAVVFSRPSLTYSSGKLYALSGGDQDGNRSQMVIFLSTDQGQTFNSVPVQTVSTWGPPAMAIVNDHYCLVWADAQRSLLHSAITKDLTKFYITDYTNGCHEGGPALVGLTDHLVVGWCYGAPPEDPNSHHITIAKLPLATSVNSAMVQEESCKPDTQRLQIRAPQPNCDPLSVWDPVQEKCVLKLGCWGNCVLSSITGIPPFGPVFNPFKYAICVISCKAKG